jgi:gliding-associated putative ABC transporter substrate-binding component GldG
MKTKSAVVSYIALVIIIVLLVNVLSEKLFFRLDFTSDHKYTMSKSTRNILKGLTQPVTVKAYFSKDLPPDVARDISRARSDFKELLVEYASISKGKLVFEFIDPKDEASEQEAIQNGIQPVIIGSREKDKSVQIKAFLGAVIKIGEKTEIIPVIQPGAALEYAVSSAIKKLSLTKKPVIAFLQGHGEPQAEAMPQVYQALSVLNGIEPIKLNDTSKVLERFNTLAIVAPKDSFPAYQLAQLDEFLNQGKNLLLAINRVQGDLNRGLGSSLNTGLEKWLLQKGISVDNNFVIDVNCASVGVHQQQGAFSYTTSVSFPYIPVLTEFAKHPITTGLSSVLMQFVSTVTFNGDSSVEFIPLVKTSKKANIRPVPVYFDIQYQWKEQDFPLSGLTVGAAVKIKTASGKTARLIVFGDGDFPVNGTGEQAMQLGADNVNLFANSIDWLSDDTGLIELRTKGIVLRPLEQIDDSTKVLLKWMNFLLPIFIIIIYGIFRMQRNKNIRMKRMEEGYV